MGKVTWGESWSPGASVFNDLDQVIPETHFAVVVILYQVQQIKNQQVAACA